MTEFHDAALVLEGGATRGVFTAGVLDYLMEKDFYNFHYVVGVSAGACNAVDFVSRQPGRTKDCMVCQDKENSYIDFRKAIRTRSLFDMDMIFNRYPNEIFPFDYETYFKSSINCELVVTNCVTGQAEYLGERANRERLMSICRASSSVPIAAPMVDIDGVPYLDGGLADSIPILRALKTGHKRNVIVLTRRKGYRKKAPGRSRAVYQTLFRKYPQLLQTIFRRHKMYNKTISYIEKWEREGKVFVIRPQMPEVSRTEQNVGHLTEFYNHGYQQMEENYEAMRGFLEEGN